MRCVGLLVWSDAQNNKGKMGMIDPYLNYCKCGWTFKISKLQKVRMLLFGDLVVSCPVCQSRMKFRLVEHAVKIETEEVKSRNDLWRNC